MDFSRPTLRVMVHGIYGILSRTGLRSCLPHRPPSLSSGFDFLFSQIRASSHERTTIAIPPPVTGHVLTKHTCDIVLPDRIRDISMLWESHEKHLLLRHQANTEPNPIDQYNHPYTFSPLARTY